MIKWYASTMSEYEIIKHWESLKIPRCQISEVQVLGDHGSLNEETSNNDYNDDQRNVVAPIVGHTNDHNPCSEPLGDMEDDTSSGMGYSGDEDSDATNGGSDQEDKSKQEQEIDNTCGTCTVCDINKTADKCRERLLYGKKEGWSSNDNVHVQATEQQYHNKKVTGHGVLSETFRRLLTESTYTETQLFGDSIIRNFRTPTIRNLTVILEKVPLCDSCTRLAPVLYVTNEDELYKGEYALTREGFKYWNKRERRVGMDLGTKLQYRLFRDQNLPGRILANGTELHLRRKASRIIVVAKREKNNNKDWNEDDFDKDPVLKEDNDDGVKMQKSGSAGLEEVELWPLSSLEINWLYGVPLCHLRNFKKITTTNGSTSNKGPHVEIHPLYFDKTVEDTAYNPPSSEIVVEQKSLIHYKTKSRWKCIAGDYFSVKKGKLGSISLLRLDCGESTSLEYLTPYNAAPSFTLFKRIRRGWGAWREEPPTNPRITLPLKGENQKASIGEEGEKMSGLSNFDWKGWCENGVIICRYCSKELNGPQQMFAHRFFKDEDEKWVLSRQHHKNFKRVLEMAQTNPSPRIIQAAKLCTSFNKNNIKHEFWCEEIHREDVIEECEILNLGMPLVLLANTDDSTQIDDESTPVHYASTWHDRFSEWEQCRSHIMPQAEVTAVPLCLQNSQQEFPDPLAGAQFNDWSLQPHDFFVWDERNNWRDRYDDDDYLKWLLQKVDKTNGLSNFDWKSWCTHGVIICRYCSKELNGPQQMFAHRFFKDEDEKWVLSRQHHKNFKRVLEMAQTNPSPRIIQAAKLCTSFNKNNIKHEFWCEEIHREDVIEECEILNMGIPSVQLAINHGSMQINDDSTPVHYVNTWDGRCSEWDQCRSHIMPQAEVTAVPLCLQNSRQDFRDPLAGAQFNDWSLQPHDFFVWDERDNGRDRYDDDDYLKFLLQKVLR